MERLTEVNKDGKWRLKGLLWSDTETGKIITQNTNEKIYGALCKLRDYENTGITPDQLQVIEEEYSKMAEELAELRQQNRWIPVSKRLPDVPVGIDDDECPEFNVMIRGARKAAALRYDSDGTWFDDFGEVYEVIAWRPLPEPYKE